MQVADDEGGEFAGGVAGGVKLQLRIGDCGLRIGRTGLGFGRTGLSFQGTGLSFGRTGLSSSVSLLR